MSGDTDHYLVLELKPGSSMAEVKSQYRRLAKRYHPDLHGNDARSQEKFRRVVAAYEFLSDPARKAAYDARLSSPTPAAKAVPPMPKAPAKPSATAPFRPPAYTPAARSLFAALGEVKASRSVWFGGTAAVVLILLGIGFCWENGGGDHEDHAGAAYAFSPGTSPSPLESGGDSNTAAPPDVPFDAPEVAPAVPETIPAPPPVVKSVPRVLRKPKVAVPKIAYTPPPFIAARPIAARPVAARPIAARPIAARPIAARPVAARPAAEAVMPTRALVKPLLMRYDAIVPRTDRLINQGYAVCDADGNDARTDQLKADLAQLNAVRNRVRPAIAHLPKKADAEELRREAAPILTDLRQLEVRPQPVQKDIQALAAAATDTARNLQ
jgi:hypothetical protein